MENRLKKRTIYPTFRFNFNSSGATSQDFKLKGLILAAILLMVFAVGCSSTKINSRNQLGNEKIQRPGRIWVYDFVATDSDVAGGSYFSGYNSPHSSPQSQHQIYMGRKLGSLIAEELVKNIRNMGMLAERAGSRPNVQLNDLVLRGYLLTVEEGDAEKRVLIGFGAGESELKIAAEAFQVTPRGWRRLGSGTADATGSKGPGSAVGAAALIAKGNPAGLIIGTGVKIYGEKTGKSKIEGRAKQIADDMGEILEQRFQEQGWIK